MGKNLFDLDLKVNKEVGAVKPSIGSVVLCTPGTCKCQDGPTLKSACCSAELTIYYCTK